MDLTLQGSTRKPFELQPMPAIKLADLVFIFALGGIIGSLYENLLIYALNGFFQNRTGSILTPFNYVYGVGGLAIYIAFHKSRSIGKVLVGGALLGGAVEYILSFLQELFLGSRSWDYTERFLNINGRTTLPYMLFWGVLCLIAIRFIIPPVIGLLRRVPDRLRKGLAAGLLLLIIADMLVSLPAVHRYTERSEGIPAGNAIEETIDTVFNDDFMERAFPNMRPHG